MSLMLIDAGPLIAYYDADDRRHDDVQRFIGESRRQFITTTPVITEVMWQLNSDYRVQNELLLLVSRGLIRNETLSAADFSRIAELNEQYRDLPADFADLSLVAIAERFDVFEIASFDKEFDVYRIRHGHRQVPFKRVLF